MKNIDRDENYAAEMSAEELLQKLKEDMSQTAPAETAQVQESAESGTERRVYKLSRRKKAAEPAECPSAEVNEPEAPVAPWADIAQPGEDGMDPAEIEAKNAEILKKLGITLEQKKPSEPGDEMSTMEFSAIGKFTLPENSSEELGDFDKTDIELMMALGLEDELAKTVNMDAVDVDMLKEEFEGKDESDYFEVEAPKKTADAPRIIKEEYSSAEQNKDILRGYKKARKSWLWRLAAAAAILAIMFFYENSVLFGFSLPEFVDPDAFGLIHILMDIQLLLLAASLVFEHLVFGIKCLLRRRPIPESVTALTVILALIFGIVCCFIGPVSGIKMYNLPACLCIFLNVLYRLMQLYREAYSFKIVSSRKLKFAINKMDPETSVSEEAVFAEYLLDDPQIFKVDRTEFIDGFYDRIYSGAHAECRVGVALMISFILSVAAYGFGVYMAHDVYRCLTDAYITFSVCAPISVFVTYGYPLFRASKKAFDDDSAIIGDQTLGEYSDVSIISVDDKDVFQSRGVKVRSVKVYGNNRIDYIIYNVASVFAKVGGPLAEVLDIATLDLGHSNDVELMNIADDGLEATVNGKTVYVGRRSFIEGCGFSTSEDADDRMAQSSGNLAGMYIAYDGALAAKMYVQYEVDAEFSDILHKLYRQGICVGVRSFDPNIDDDLLAHGVDIDKYPIRIIKTARADQIPAALSSTESGIVSREGTKSLLKTLYLASKILLGVRANRIIRNLALTVAALLMAFAIFSGALAALPSVYVMLYQLLWMLPMYLITRLYLR